MVFLGALIGSKMLNSSSIENFRDSMIVDDKKEIKYNDYYKSVLNSSTNFIFLCIILMINVVPALLISYNCKYDNGLNKVLTMIIALLFSDLYIFYYAIRKYVYNKKYCN